MLGTLTGFARPPTVGCSVHSNRTDGTQPIKTHVIIQLHRNPPTDVAPDLELLVDVALLDERVEDVEHTEHVPDVAVLPQLLQLRHRLVRLASVLCERLELRDAETRGW